MVRRVDRAGTALTAPAVDLIGARPGGYWRVQGTSFAAPLVAGTAALIRSRWPTMSAPNVINRLISTADRPDPQAGDQQDGYGEVDPQRALTADVAPFARNPLLPAVPPPATPASGGGAVDPTPQRTTMTPSSPNRPTPIAATMQLRHRPDWQFAAGGVALAGTLGTGLIRRRRRQRRQPAPL